MENKLEQLLNSLIDKGWKPRNCNYQKYEDGCLIYEKMGNNGVYSIGQYPVSLREITSKNSGLWQFVCENGMVDMEYKRPANYTYRLIESALKDESELEDLLLNSIKLD